MGNLNMPKAITAMIVVVALAWSGFVSCPTFAHGINAAQARGVRFEIGAGPFSVQLSGVPKDRIKIAIRRAE